MKHMTTLAKLLTHELGRSLKKCEDWKAYAKSMGEEVTRLNREVRVWKRRFQRATTVKMTIHYDSDNEDGVLL